MKIATHFRIPVALFALAAMHVAPLASFAQAPVEGSIDDLPTPPVQQVEPTQTVTTSMTQNAITSDIELMVGDIFEILPVHSFRNASYTWILTQDRTFIEAMRTQTFRKRVIQPGRYSLFAEVASEDGNKRISKTFTLLYTAREPGQLPTNGTVNATGSSMELVTTSPPLQSGKAVLGEGTNVLKLTPITQDITPLVLDTDINVDENGDGDSRNDIASNQTFFQSDATPLYLWFTEQSTEKTMSVTAALPDGARVQEIPVLDALTAAEAGILRVPASIEAEQTDARTFVFSSGLPSGVNQADPILYQWEFGDGKKSLLAEPTHTYAADGTYTVRLTIQSLTNGRKISEEELALVISAEGTGVLEPETPIDAPTEEQADQAPGFFSSIPVGSVLLYGGIFIGALIVGFLIIFLFSKLRKGGNLSERLEAMEESVIQKNTTEKVENATPTLTIAPAPVQTAAATAPINTPITPPPEVAKKEAERTELRPSAQSMPKANPQNAPAWLKSGLNAQNPSPGASSATPLKAPAPPAKQNPTQRVNQGSLSTPTTTPTWLKNSEQTTPAPTSVTQKPAAVPKPTPAPPSAPAQETNAQSAPMPPITGGNSQIQKTTSPATVPAWLKTPSNTPKVPGETGNPAEPPSSMTQTAVNPPKAQESVKPTVNVPPVAANTAMPAVENTQTAKAISSSAVKTPPAAQVLSNPATAQTGSFRDNPTSNTQSTAAPQNTAKKAIDTPVESTDEPIAIIRADSINTENAQKDTKQQST